MQPISPDYGARVWRNGRIPVVYKPGRHESLLVRVPYQQNNRDAFCLADEGSWPLAIGANTAIFSVIDAVIRALRRTRVSGAVTLSNFSVPADVTVTLPKPLSLLPEKG